MSAAAVAITEAEFRFDHNESAMASEKLADGIRRFVADQRQLEAALS
jgi:transaldolase